MSKETQFRRKKVFERGGKKKKRKTPTTASLAKYHLVCLLFDPLPSEVTVQGRDRIWDNHDNMYKFSSFSTRNEQSFN